MSLAIFEISFSLFMLIILELMLSIDNILFIGISTSNLALNYQKPIRQIAVFLSIVIRILLLIAINWLYTLKSTLFTIYSLPISTQSLIKIAGGLYLIYFALTKIIQLITPFNPHHTTQPTKSNPWVVLTNIIIGDCLFCLDSVLTAVSIGYNLYVMIIAIIVACIIMLININFLSNFINQHQQFKVSALLFLMLIGISLLSEAFSYHLNNTTMVLIMVFVIVTQYITYKLLLTRNKNPIAKKSNN